MKNSIERPLAISTICILGFSGILLVFPAIALMPDGLVLSWYPPYLIFSALIGMACILGLWQMKKWAVYFYSAFIIFNLIALLYLHVPTIYTLIIPMVVIAVSWLHIKKMH